MEKESMSGRSAYRVAWCIWALVIVISAVTLVLQVKNAPSAWLVDSVNSLILLAFATIGALIASRRPENRIGWIFSASALLWALGTFGEEYAVYTIFTAPGSLPGGALLGVLGDAIAGMAWFLPLTFLLLLFPDGHLLSTRWRPLAWLIAVLLASWVASILFAPYSQGADARLATVRSPLGIPAAEGLLNALSAAIPLVLMLTVLICIVGVIQRFRRARGAERQQLKWFAYGMFLTALVILAIGIVIFTPWLAPSTLFYLAIVCIPISSGVAILRYRLYDIDILINLTLVYGLLTATLLAVYLALVIGGQHLVSSFFGPNNAPVLVVSTLLVAALFQPLRLRLQRLVDRRFYRSKYDAAQVIAHFGETLRQEVNLEELQDHLLAVIDETVQPAHLSLWLRSPERPPRA
jgi:hypothetical protein